MGVACYFAGCSIAGVIFASYPATRALSPSLSVLLHCLNSSFSSSFISYGDKQGACLGFLKLFPLRSVCPIFFLYFILFFYFIPFSFLCPFYSIFYSFRLPIPSQFFPFFLNGNGNIKFLNYLSNKKINCKLTLSADNDIAYANAGNSFDKN